MLKHFKFVISNLKLFEFPAFLSNTPVNVRCIFYRGSRRRVDLCNLLASIDDILVKHGVLADDNRNIVYAHDGSRVYYSKENPRTEIEITKITDENVERWSKE